MQHGGRKMFTNFLHVAEMGEMKMIKLVP